MIDDYYKEIKLSRVFSRQFDLYMQQNNDKIPDDLVKAYNDLIHHYHSEMEKGIQ